MLISAPFQGASRGVDSRLAVGRQPSAEALLDPRIYSHQISSTAGVGQTLQPRCWVSPSITDNGFCTPSVRPRSAGGGAQSAVECRRRCTTQYTLRLLADVERTDPTTFPFCTDGSSRRRLFSTAVPPSFRLFLQQLRLRCDPSPGHAPSGTEVVLLYHAGGGTGFGLQLRSLVPESCVQIRRKARARRRILLTSLFGCDFDASTHTAEKNLDFTALPTGQQGHWFQGRTTGVLPSRSPRPVVGYRARGGSPRSSATSKCFKTASTRQGPHFARYPRSSR